MFTNGGNIDLLLRAWVEKTIDGAETLTFG